MRKGCFLLFVLSKEVTRHIRELMGKNMERDEVWGRQGILMGRAGQAHTWRARTRQGGGKCREGWRFGTVWERGQDGQQVRCQQSCPQGLEISEPEER